MSTTPDNFDFFVSYARSDNTNGWITRFVEELLAEHKRFSSGREMNPFFDQHAITTGADWQLYLAHGIAQSRLFLAFLSPNYFASKWCRKEWRAWMDAEIAQHILTAGVRPIYIVEVPGLTGKDQLSDLQLAKKLAELSKLPESDQAKLIAETPPVVKHLRRRQLTHNQPFSDIHAFFDAGLEALRREDLRQVLDQLARDLDHHAALLAKADASLSTVPAYNKNFTGRLDELLLLRERLIKDDRTGVIYGIQGLGGIGKTELALTYAHAYASAYPGGRFLIRCDGKSVLRDAVLGQSDFTGLFGDQISDEERKLPDAHFDAILRCLRARLDQLGHVLLVLDNVSDLKVLDPQQTDTMTVLGPKLHLLATTRLVPPTQGKSNWLSLGRLPDDDALDMLEKLRPIPDESEREAARRIVRRLGGFTLAIELVAAWLAIHTNVSCSGFLDRLGMEHIETLDEIAEERDVTLRRHNDERRLAAVLDPTLDTLAPAERRALEYAALLSPDHVALPWLRTLVGGDFPEAVQAPPPGRPDLWRSLLNRLTGLTLFVRPETETNEPRLLSVHRLIQDRMRHRVNPEELGARHQALDALVAKRTAALESATHREEASWELDSLVSLALLWAESVETKRNRRNEHGMPCARRTAWLLNQVAMRREELAQWSSAEALYRRSLAIVEQSVEPDHPDIGSSLSNLGLLLKTTNRHSEGEPLIRRAIEIDERCFGTEHPRTATSLSNLASLLHASGRNDEAEMLFRRAMEILERSRGPAHPEVAVCLNNLALVLKTKGRLSEAEPLYLRALSIHERIFGQHHPTVATGLNNLASLFDSTGRLTEAERLYRRALTIREQFFGQDHPKLATSLNNLALLLTNADRPCEAEPLMRRSIKVLLNLSHASVRLHERLQSAAMNYARILHLMGRAPTEIRTAFAELGIEPGIEIEKCFNLKYEAQHGEPRPFSEPVSSDQS